ncbi:hypothetical protein ACIGNX_04960 [Actinosynnema sp. NPDC053489]|uniref:hypothetical protein n=1 Tax=Actinosynnema sp. NPDC053489 TaxID=3363916 RepID=UPI0037CB32AF
MTTTIVLLVLLVLVGAVWYSARSAAEKRRRELEDAQAEARRWVERLGGQVMNLTGTDVASQQAMADASERFTAAGSQMEQARTVEQCRLVTQTAMEGLYYVRAARVAMDLDPGPELPDLTGQSRAGAVSEERDVTVEGHRYAASPRPGAQTPHYYPGGVVAGRPVPQGWYSEPWWKPALVAGAWTFGSMMLFNAMFVGMAGVPAAVAAEDYGDGGDAGDGGDSGDSGDVGGDAGGDYGGDFGGGDFGGGDFGGDFGGGFDF